MFIKYGLVTWMANFFPGMVVANSVLYRQYFHHVGYDCDPSDVD